MESEVWRRINARRLGRRRVLTGGAGLGTGLAGVALVGCGNDDDDGNGSGNGGNGNGNGNGGSPSTSPTASQAGGNGGGSGPSGEIRMALVTLGDQSSDPHVQNAGNNLPIIDSCFEQFERIGPDGQYMPALGTSIEESPDYLEMSIKLRPDAKFWDGSAVTTEDVIWSFERWVAQEPPDSSAVTGDDVIESVTAPDEETILVRFTAPSTLRMRWSGIAPRGWNIASRAYYDSVGEDEFRQVPMATGPYRLVSNVAQSHVELEAFADHYELVPGIARIRMELVPEQSTRVARLQTGEAAFADGLLGPALQTLESDDALEVYESEATAKCTIYFHSPDEAPYNDARFRKALGFLIDQQAIVDSLLQGHGMPAPNPHIFTITDAYDPAVIPAQPHDPEQARALLDEAGYGDGVQIKIWSYDSSSVQAIPDSIVAVRSMWAEAGVEAEIEQVEAGAYFERYRAKSLGDVAVLGSGAGRFADATLNTFYGQPEAYGTLVPDDLRQDILDLAHEFDEEAQIQQAQQIYLRIIDEAWSITLPYTNSVWGVRKDQIADWQVMPGNAYPATFYTMVPA